ncbi:hypothetical protein EQ828_23685 [Ectopseudomonas mendocina]|nr:plasmid partition protein ParG [Pseudomonas mendocina]TRO11629.1 hypothetical protein EQ828_23685 [Pseudomonas mendocina]
MSRKTGTPQEVPNTALEKAKAEETKRLNVNVPVSKHEAFRLKCMTNHTTMTDELLKFIDSYIE